MRTRHILHIIVFIFVFEFPQISIAQKNYSITPAFESLISTNDSLPFWLTHNQYGKYTIDNNPTQLLSINANYKKQNILNTPINVELGTYLITLYSNDINVQLNELYAKAFFKGWKLEAGLFHEPEYIDGISSTNGNIDRSNNARPYPRIRFGTNEFIPFLFWKNWFTFKAEWDEGILNDERQIMGTKLHHKSLYLKSRIYKSFKFTFGLNHYVMWGGISKDSSIGQLPEGFKNYLLYITGSAGTEEFPEMDQGNVAGNQLGSYYFQFELNALNTDFCLYINHPFDDHGGMEMNNSEDNLYGLFAKFGDNKIIESAVYEFTYTIWQGGYKHIAGVVRGRDDYYNHGLYYNGFTYQNYVMCTPLIGPINYNLQNIIENTRIKAHHIGLKGSIGNYLTWNSKFTYTYNLGTYNVPYDNPKKQFSGYLNISYMNTQWPINPSCSIAGDLGNLYGNNLGVMLKFEKTF